MKHSISKKILKATLYWLEIIVVLIAAISVLIVNHITSTDSNALITQCCKQEQERFNCEFKILENSVETIANYVADLEEESSSEDELFSDEFCNKVQDMTLSIASRTDGAMAVYFRYNPDLTGSGTQGFFWSRNNDTEDFAYCDPTDILQYDLDDTEHVGWFYEPKNKHEALWMSPYYNKNLDVFMISYVVPYYTQSGDFLGVIGMDIDFEKIIRMTEDVSLYKTGKIKLIDLTAYLVYSSGENDTVCEENLSTTVYNHVTTVSQDETTLKLKDDNGKRYITSMSALENGMKLMLLVPQSEINAQRNNMLMLFAVLVVIIIIITVLNIVKVTNKIVNPLKILTRITGKYAQNDWSETYISNTQDEIQDLSESISTMAGTTKSYIEMINKSATTDTLTGLKNKNCYMSYIEKYSDITPSDNIHYAVVIFDINFLKKVNDNYGHEAGDELIKTAGKYICDIFSHSPVFRIGGDEFNAVLENRDYTDREQLCENFANKMKNLSPVFGDIPLSISYGIASFPEDGKCYEEVFKCADERMYEYKKIMKVGRV